MNTRARTRRTGLLVAAVVAVVGVLAPPSQASKRTVVVALGDSFSAGSGIADVEVATGCQRSDRNYVKLVARAMRARYRDATCGSATTDHAYAPQQTGANGTGSVPPQLDAVRPGTDVVLVSLGLNDLQFLYDMIYGCIPMSDLQPTGTPCQTAWALTGHPGPIQRLPEIHDRLLGVVEQARARAPRATVMVVGYPQLVPASGTCADLPLPTGEYAYFHAAFEQLGATMASVARETGTAYVDVLAASEGHDICAPGSASWVNGRTLKPGVALAYHPYANEQRAIGRLVLQRLRTLTRGR